MNSVDKREKNDFILRYKVDRLRLGPGGAEGAGERDRAERFIAITSKRGVGRRRRLNLHEHTGRRLPFSASIMHR